MFLTTLRCLKSQANVDLTAVIPARGALNNEIEAMQVDVRLMSFEALRRVNLRVTGIPATTLRMIGSLPRIVSFLKETNANVVFVNTIVCPIWILAGKLAKCRVVCHVHENEADMSRLLRKALLTPLKMSDLAIANSLDTARWIVATIGQKHSVAVIYNGFDLPRDQPLRQPIDCSAPVTLLVLGRLAHRKGQDVAIRALSILKADGYQVKLQLVGDHFPGYEDYVDGLTRLVTELGLSDAVSFDGFAAEPKAFMTNATVMLVPSRAEPFGNVAVEGLGAGIPMVVSQVGGLPEIIKNEETGLCVPPDDPQALAAAVSRHLQNPHEAAQMSRAGFIDARKRFGLNAYRDGIVASVSGKVADLNPL